MQKRKIKWLDLFPKYDEEIRQRLISEARNWIKYRDYKGWAGDVFKAFLIENEILKDKIKKLEEKNDKTN